MKKAPLLALAALPFVAGCKERSCLEHGLDTTLELVREFNDGRCHSSLHEDTRHFDCPTGTMNGTINGHTFDFRLERGGDHWIIGQESTLATCHDEIFTLDNPANQVIQQRLMAILQNLEVD